MIIIGPFTLFILLMLFCRPLRRFVGLMFALLILLWVFASSGAHASTPGDRAIPGIYAPIICNGRFCSGPQDPAYTYPSLIQCKTYLLELRVQYLRDGEQPPAGRLSGYCVFHASGWQRVP